MANMAKLELVETFGKCPRPYTTCLGEKTTFRFIRDAETKRLLDKGIWYSCPEHPSPFLLPQTVAEALEMREKWLQMPDKEKGRRFPRVIDTS